MHRFQATLQKFNQQGEKTGWTYIQVPVEITEQMKPGVHTAYRVKGKLDDYTYEKVSLIPMGGGQFIIAVNATMRKAIGKQKGAVVKVLIDVDDRAIEINPEFIECMNDEPTAKEYFFSLPQGHRNYFSKWIDSAKTIETKTKRIAMAVNALARRQGYSEMIRANKSLK
jgi:hypothetical protein